MGWRDRSDLGLEIVAHAHDTLRINDHWVVDQDRGFTWWAGDLAQKVWAEHGVFLHAASEFAVHCETDFLKGHGQCSQLATELIDAMDKATLSGIVYDEADDTYRLCCTIVATADSEAWIKHTFLCAVGLQLSEAHRTAHEMAARVRAVAATTGHPHHGLRGQPDPMVGAIQSFFRPAGQAPSRWLGIEEWENLDRLLERHVSRMDCDKRSRLAAEFPMRDSGMIQLVANAADPHPDLGNGLHVDLTLPGKYAPELGAGLALSLNALERKEWRRSQFFGSWGVHDGYLGFHSFLPNTAYHAGSMTALVLSNVIRVEWVQENFTSMVRRFLTSA